MILTGEAKKKAYSKAAPCECSFEELVTLLCTADGKGAEYKLKCVRELLSYNEFFMEEFRTQIDTYLTKSRTTE